MRRSHDRYNDVEPSSSPQSSPDYTIVIRDIIFGRDNHLHDVEAVVLELLEKPGQGGRRRRMDIMQEQNAFAESLKPAFDLSQIGKACLPVDFVIIPGA
jgi:hypothetical protein